MSKIKLSEICHGRSGDKGDAANVGLIAYKKENYELIKARLPQMPLRNISKVFV